MALTANVRGALLQLAAMGLYAESELMIKAGLYAPGTDPRLDEAVRLWPALRPEHAPVPAPDPARATMPGVSGTAPAPGPAPASDPAPTPSHAFEDAR